MKYIKKFNTVFSLQKGLVNQSGRNNEGKITTRHHGGGHKKAFRILDWSRSQNNAVVIGFEYDPIRSAPLIKLYNENKYSYILASSGVKIFQQLNTYSSIKNKEISIDSSINHLLKAGDSAPISFFEVGDFIHSMEAFPGQGAIFGRASGSYCQVISINQIATSFIKNKASDKFAIVRLPSGSKRLININVQASLGIVYQKDDINRNIEKAGRMRWLGWRPSVRGVAINPIDHPHGGGQGKTSGGRPSVTFKSWPTKGQPTRSPKRKNKFILKF